MSIFDRFLKKRTQQVPELIKGDGWTRDSLLTEIGHLRVPAVGIFESTTMTSSHLGGLPNLPTSFEWPTYKGRSLSFLAQFDLAEIHDARLPASGTLAFFYDQDQKTWGFDPTDAGSWNVAFFPADPASMPVRPLPADIPDYASFDNVLVELRDIQVYPSFEAEAVEALNLQRGSVDLYFDIATAPFGDKPSHQLLGFPAPIQGDCMEEECQMASSGVYMGSGIPSANPRYDELQDGIGEWMLLLQLDSDDAPGFMWGDCGRLYFWIKKGDLQNKDFTRVWMILQCS